MTDLYTDVLNHINIDYLYTDYTITLMMTNLYTDL